MYRIILSALLCCATAAAVRAQQPGKGLTATLDCYYNYEHKKDKEGKLIRWHYIWDEQDSGGLSVWGHILDSLGVQRDTLHHAPDAASLQHTDIYIIIDPDNEKDAAAPNYMTAADAAAIYNWVKAGGILVILQNDGPNAEYERFNLLTEKFGIHFNGDLRNTVQGRNWEQGALRIPPKHEIFPNVQKVYIKEISTMTLKSPARSVYTDGKDVLMAVAKIGRGTVFAVGDPWFYNEYVDGKRLPPEYQNYAAAADLSAWLIRQAARKK
ncbi:hypothetical protein ECE50_011805 [Chitinophaga sp. Mgbs1]|uniref:DUF4350 domain-containing protein n=1 Tax=Chitinophaga solisilvae TaxID=1233460 RepID=A0A433WCM2_9BACT|nr:hypothetical protein [Chitinophaga solisilvae]